MAAITAAMVKELRDKTDAGMMDCKKALTETNGDMEAAVEFLRKSGMAKAEKRADKVTKEGKIFAAVNGYMQDIQIERIGEFEKRLIEYMELNERPFLDQILEEGKLSEAMEQELRDDIVKFRKTVKSDILIDSQKALRHEELAEEDAAIDAARAEAEKAL